MVEEFIRGKEARMKVVAFIPIKLNSERIAGKNVKCFYDGTPLMQIMQKKLLEMKEIDEIYVFGSSDKIRDFICPGIKFIKRPEYLDLPDATPQDIIKEFMKVVDSDIYMVSHVTSPFVTNEHLVECINAVAIENYDSAFTAEKMLKLLWTQENKPLNFNPEKTPRTQDLSPLYSEVSAAYVFRKDTFEKYGRRIGVHPYIVTVSGIESVDIDYPEDFEIANILYKNIVCKEVDDECSNS